MFTNKRLYPVAPLRFFTSCVNVAPLDVVHLTPMIEQRVNITLATFKRHVHPLDYKAVTEALGYGPDLALRNDRHVSYYRSAWRGQTCVFMLHSAIEYIFTEHGHETAYQIPDPTSWAGRVCGEATRRTCRHRRAVEDGGHAPSPATHR